MFHIRVRNNVKIAVYDLNPKASNIVVMIHGWPLSEKIFEYQKQLLVEQGYRVITMDLRGFGASDASAFGYTYDQFAEDIYRVIRTMGLRSFTLVGFSSGGAVIIRYMRLFQGYGVKKLILLSAPAPRFSLPTDHSDHQIFSSMEKMIHDIKLDRAQFSTTFCQGLFAQPHSGAIQNWFISIAQNASPIATIQTAYTLQNESCDEDLPFIHVPTGIFHGKKDAIIPHTMAEYLSTQIANAKLFSFEHSGHAIFYDELERFNSEFLNFLQHTF